LLPTEHMTPLKTKIKECQSLREELDKHLETYLYNLDPLTPTNTDIVSPLRKLANQYGECIDEVGSEIRAPLKTIECSLI
jgi:hypothetical protein